MIARTRQQQIRFRQPFAVPGFEGMQPAGHYTVETEEELLESLSFPAYRRLSTTLTPCSPSPGALIQAIPIDPRDLAASLAKDRLAADAA